MPKRIKDYGTAATTIAADDYFAIDGVTNGTRKALLPSIGATGLLFGAGTNAAPKFAVGTSTSGIFAAAAEELTFTTNSVEKWAINSAGNFYSDVQATPLVKFQPATATTLCGLEWYTTAPAITGFVKYDVNAAELRLNSGAAASTGKITFYNNNVDVCRITSAGNFTVGVTSSELGLTAAGGLKIGSTTSAVSSVAGAVVIGDMTAATTVAIGAGKLNAGTSVTAPLVLGGTSTTQDLTLQTTSGIGASGADMHFLVGNNGATEAMTILNSGNVGIGTLTPAQKLDVAGRIIVDNNFGYTQRSSAGVTVTVLNVTGSDNLTVGQTSTQNDIYFNVGSVANALNIKATSGNVGIGTTAPDKALEINSATGANLRLTYNDSNGGALNYADLSTSSGGNLTIAPSGGALSVTGSISASTYTAGSVQSLTGAGAVNVTTAITEVTTTGVSQALTLADGAAGQEKTIIHGVDGGSFVLTPTTKTGWSTFTSTVYGESITLVYLTTRGWIVKGSYLGVIAP